MSKLVKQLRSEAANWAGDLLDDAADRIETLEKALREIAHGEDFEHETIGVALEHARSTAQAALAEGQDK